MAWYFLLEPLVHNDRQAATLYVNVIYVIRAIESSDYYGFISFMIVVTINPFIKGKFVIIPLVI